MAGAGKAVGGRPGVVVLREFGGVDERLRGGGTKSFHFREIFCKQVSVAPPQRGEMREMGLEWWMSGGPPAALIYKENIAWEMINGFNCGWL